MITLSGKSKTKWTVDGDKITVTDRRSTRVSNIANIATFEHLPPQGLQGSGHIRFKLSGSGAVSAIFGFDEAIFYKKTFLEDAEKLCEYINNYTQTVRIESSPAAEATPEDLLKFKELLDAGAITQEEYNAKKKQVLGL